MIYLNSMHRWASTAPAFTSPSDNLALRKPIKAVKMLKMQIDPTMCMKTKGAHDKMTGVSQNFEGHFMQIGGFLPFQKRKMGENGPFARGVGQRGAGFGGKGSCVFGAGKRPMTKGPSARACREEEMKG